MIPAERQAMREKHREIFDEWGSICNYCEGSRGYEKEKMETEKGLPYDEPINFYPCDVIKVLDAWEIQERNALIQDLIHFADDE